MARGHPAKRGSVLDSLRSAGDDLVSIGEGETVGFNQHRQVNHYDWRLCGVCMESLPIPYSLTDFGRAQLELWRAMEAQAAGAGGVQTSTETQSPRQPSCR